MYSAFENSFVVTFNYLLSSINHVMLKRSPVMGGEPIQLRVGCMPANLAVSQTSMRNG